MEVTNRVARKNQNDLEYETGRSSRTWSIFKTKFTTNKIKTSV